MLKKSKYFIPVVLIAILLPLAINAQVNSSDELRESSALTRYKNKEEKEIQSELKKLSKEQVIDEINSISKEVDIENNTNVIIPFALNLFERNDEFSDEEMVEIVTNNSNAIITQQLMIDLYTLRNENKFAKNDLKRLLKEDVKDELKLRIITRSSFAPTEVQILKDFIKEDQDDLAFASLKRLSQIDVKDGYKISKDILSNYKNQSPKKISAALKSTAKYFRSDKSKNSELKSEFINVCLDVINTTQDEILKDTSIFALSDLMDQEAITKIIDNSAIDEQLKVFSVDQNVIVLKNILLNNPTEEEIKIVVEAMEILPIIDLVEPLEEVKKTITDKNLEKRCEDVLEIMRLYGHKENLKWRG